LIVSLEHFQQENVSGVLNSVITHFENIGGISNHLFFNIDKSWNAFQKNKIKNIIDWEKLPKKSNKRSSLSNYRYMLFLKGLALFILALGIRTKIHGVVVCGSAVKFI